MSYNSTSILRVLFLKCDYKGVLLVCIFIVLRKCFNLGNVYRREVHLFSSVLDAKSPGIMPSTLISLLLATSHHSGWHPSGLGMRGRDIMSEVRSQSWAWWHSPPLSTQEAKAGEAQ